MGGMEEAGLLVEGSMLSAASIPLGFRISSPNYKFYFYV